MKKPWSISTTVRNPERLRDFLSVLKILEGEFFNSKNQIKYQIILIQNKIYEPTNLTKEQKEYFDDIEKEMPFSIAKEIFDAKNYNDPPHRGRQSFNPLKKFGFATIIDGKVRITELGNHFLGKDYDMGEIFFRSFLKWKIQN